MIERPGITGGKLAVECARLSLPAQSGQGTALDEGLSRLAARQEPNAKPV
jgi:hypothetical protein